MNQHAPSQKNIVYGTITAGGNVHIGDVIYNVSEDFHHSILFLRIDKAQLAAAKDEITEGVLLYLKPTRHCEERSNL